MDNDLNQFGEVFVNSGRWILQKAGELKKEVDEKGPTEELVKRWKELVGRAGVWGRDLKQITEGE